MFAGEATTMTTTTVAAGSVPRLVSKVETQPRLCIGTEINKHSACAGNGAFSQASKGYDRQLNDGNLALNHFCKY